MPTLILLRHGQSEWNAENRFTGWTDVDLSQLGVAEAMSAGEILARTAGVPRPSVVHTSVLTRATRTAAIACESLDLTWIPVRRHWRLNERHYGNLQGLDKRESSEQFGVDQVKAWRRGYDTPPPPLDWDDERHPRFDPRYRHIPPRLLPSAECLADVLARMLPYWVDGIAPDLYAGETVLVVAHGNSLRALVKYLDRIADDEITGVEIPTGIPLVYELNEELDPAKTMPLNKRYLGDPAQLKQAQEEVARQATPT